MTSAHSSAIAHRLLKLDYSGICISICVTNISSTHFGLSDKTGLQMLYNTVCILWGLGVLVSLLGPNTDGPGAALFRYVLSPQNAEVFARPRTCSLSLSYSR